MVLTKVCYNCSNHKCLGGYNCKKGAISTEYVICYEDLTIGRCSNPCCTKKHLSQRGLTPFKIQDIVYYNNNRTNKKYYVEAILENCPKPIELSKETFPSLCPNGDIDNESMSSLSDNDETD